MNQRMRAIRPSIMVIAAAAAGLLLAGSSAAQVNPGAFRIGAGIGGFQYSDIDVEGVSVETNEFSIGPSGELRLGYAADERYEFGVITGLEYVDIDVEGISDDATSWRLGPYAELNFPVGADGRAVLAPGLGILYVNLDGSGLEINGVQFRASASFKYFVVENASVEAGLEFAYLIGSADAGGIDLDADGFSIGPRVGISIWPR